MCFYLLLQACPLILNIYLTSLSPTVFTMGLVQWVVASHGFFNMSLYIVYFKEFCKLCDKQMIEGRHPALILMILMVVNFGLPSVLGCPWMKCLVSYLTTFTVYNLFILPHVVGGSFLLDFVFVTAIAMAVVSARTIESMSRVNFAGRIVPDGDEELKLREP